jgi:Ala-tRNA(Pro) deacylase
MPSQDIQNYLRQLGIDFVLHEHAPVYTCDEAAKIYTPEMGVQTKNIFLRDKKGRNHYLLTLTADKQVDLAALRNFLGSTKLSFASPERLKARLNVTPGSVSPFGLIFDQNEEVQFLLDEDLLKPQQMHFHPNNNTESLQISNEDLVKFLKSLPHQWQAITVPVL